MTAATITVYPGLNSSGASLTVYAEDLATLIPADGATVPYTAYYTAMLANGRLMTSDPLAGSGDAITVTPVTRTSAALVGQVTPQMYGAVADGVTDCAAALQLAVDSGAREVRFSPGTYRVTRQIFVRANVALACDSPSCAIVSYDSSNDNASLPDYAFVVNSKETVFGGPDQAALVTSIEFNNLKISTTAGGGIFVGTTTNLAVLLNGLELDDIVGRALFLGESVYFVTMRKCVVERSLGIVVSAYCDGFTMRECAFGSNRDYDLQLGSPTFFIDGSFFEGNLATAGNKANILIKTSDVESGHGTITNVRFGPEFGAGVGTTTAPHDIEFSNAGTTSKTVRGVRLLNNRHFSCSDDEGTPKVSPILLDAGLGLCSIENMDINGAAPVSSASPGYSSQYQITTSSAANVVNNTSFVGNKVDELAMVEPTVRVVFDETVKSSVSYRRVLTGHQIDQWYVVGIDWSDTSYGRIGLEKVYKTDSFPHLSRRVVGVMPITSATDARVHIFTEGSLIRTELNTAAGYVLGDPIFIGANGKLSLTPHGTFRKIVGQMVSLENGCLVRLDFSQPVQWFALPGTSSGRWKAGEEVLSATMAVAGAAASQYIVRGWKRLTDSNAGATNNTLNTDWVELRTLTGT